MKLLNLFERSEVHNFIYDITKLVLNKIKELALKIAQEHPDEIDNYFNELDMLFSYASRMYKTNGLSFKVGPIPKNIRDKWGEKYGNVLDSLSDTRILLRSESFSNELAAYHPDTNTIIIKSGAFPAATITDDLDDALESGFRSVSHELTHLYQDIMSGGKAFVTKQREKIITDPDKIDYLENDEDVNRVDSVRYDKLLKKKIPVTMAYTPNGKQYQKRGNWWYETTEKQLKTGTKGHTEYWSSQHEIDARFSDAVSEQIPILKKQIKEYPNELRQIYQKFLNNVLDRIEPEDVKISPKLKNHYIKRAGKVFSDVVQSMQE